MLRPAPRRASQQSASPYGSGLSHNPPGGRQPRGAAASYGPDGSRPPYDPAAPYEGPARPSPALDPRRRYEALGPGPAAGYPPRYDQAPPPLYPHTRPHPVYEPEAGVYEPEAGVYEPDDPYQDGPDLWPSPGQGQTPPPGRRSRRRNRMGPDGKKRPGRIRRLLRRRTVKVILALIAVFCCWAAFSIGQTLTAPGGGSLSSKMAEWARDHYLGPVVTFGEWLTYNPPKVGGQPGFSLAAPGGTQGRFKKVHGFAPIIPARLSSPAGHPLAGEGVWRLLETVRKEPAIWSTFLRPSSVYTSYVSGIVSMDQRLVKFQLRPGAEDPGRGNWKAQPWIPPGTRAGLLATFNGGFKLDASEGGFYLNGVTKGRLVNGAASIVYYRNGTIRIGTWGTEVGMTANVAGVRQNLKPLVDHGRIPANVSQAVNSAWGATLGGGYYVWRSGLGITRDGRIIFVYGPALNVPELASLLKQAGAVEALQLDINPEWMSYDYYKGNAANPVPHAMLPTQQATPSRYYSVYSRDFTAVYSR